MKHTFYPSIAIIGLIVLWTVPYTGQLSISDTGIDYTIDFDNGIAGVNNGVYDGGGVISNACKTAASIFEISSTSLRIKPVIDSRDGLFEDFSNSNAGIPKPAFTP